MVPEVQEKVGRAGVRNGASAPSDSIVDWGRDDSFAKRKLKDVVLLVDCCRSRVVAGC